MTSPRPHTSSAWTDDVLLDKHDVASRWGCSTKTVERRIAEGTLKATYIGRLLRFRRENVLAAEKKMQK
jgi:excisionase family DNA binding protein